MAAPPPEPLMPVPTAEQLAWQDIEYGMFCHFGINTFHNEEWTDGTKDPKTFNPTDFNARQWVETAKDAGMKYLVVTAKHHDGFCTYQTAYTDYGVKSSPWRKGKGDVIREVSTACHDLGIMFGFYLSPWDRHEPKYQDNKAYDEHFKNQLRELLTGYGDVGEAWFDGAGTKGHVYDWEGYYALIRELQPHALTAIMGPDIRWVGNENGVAPETLWNVEEREGKKVWRPAECDVPIRKRHWFFHTDDEGSLLSTKELLDIYYKSVGRGANLLLNVSPDRRGQLPESDTARLREVWKILSRTFRVNLAQNKPAEASNVRGNDTKYGAVQALDGNPDTYWATDDDVKTGCIVVDLGKPATFNRSMIQEHIALGQRVEEYSIDILEGREWKKIAKGTTIGHKRLDRFPRVTTTKVRFNIVKALACPVIGEIGLYYEPEPIPRKECFYGLHFDLHPQKSDTSLGADLTEENVAQVLKRVRPDYVQYDCKGHAGYTGYPAKIGWPSPGIVKDSLAIWRKVTREYGVGLYIHYSGVWDSVAVEHHPEWARIDAKGNRDRNATSTFGPYVDELLIPQLKEVTSAYDLDGMWVDGECWATQFDYSPAALEAWRKETGYQDAPKDRSEPHWLEWKMFHRRQFEKYLCHWVDALHEFNPGLQITSNWMYSTFAPKPVAAKLDFLSGDYSPTFSVDRARVEARYLANTGMPWDLMAWGFTRGQNRGIRFKSAIHLQQEASVVLMQGGGFQIYYKPTRSGYINKTMIETAGKVAAFCRERQKVSHKSTTIPQVALLLSSETHWDQSERVFATWEGEFNKLEGALHALLELHYSVDILAEHQLQPRLQDYPLVVLPDCPKLTDDFKKSLLAYVERGGSLLLLGLDSANLFEPVLGVRYNGEAKEKMAILESPAGVIGLNGEWQDVALSKAEAIGYRYTDYDTRKKGMTASTVVSHGKGKIGAVYGPVALDFYNMHHPTVRRFIGDVVRVLFPDPTVYIEGPSYVDIALRHTEDGRTSVHFLNRANVPHGDRFPAVDSIPPAGPIELKIKVPQRPNNVQWIPGGKTPAWNWMKGELITKVNDLHVHGVLVIE